MPETLASAGKALDAPTRLLFEERLGVDLGDVRIHDDGPSHHSTASLKARAYTVGRDVAFGAGEYQPDTDSGRALLAHELAHVVQQGAASPGTIRRQALDSADASVSGSPDAGVPYTSPGDAGIPSGAGPDNIVFENHTLTDDAAAIRAILESIETESGQAGAGRFVREFRQRVEDDHIRETWDNLLTGDLQIWRLGPIVELTQRTMNATPMQRRLVSEQVEHSSESGGLRTALAIIGFGLGLIAAIPTGGASLALTVGTGAAAIGSGLITGYLAIEHIREYQVQAAASGTDFDKARAISHEDPSLFWLALDLVATGLDVAMAGAAFRRLMGLAREALRLRRAATAVEQAEQALTRLANAAEAERPGRGLGQRITDDIITQARRAGEHGDVLGEPPGCGARATAHQPSGAKWVGKSSFTTRNGARSGGRGSPPCGGPADPRGPAPSLQRAGPARQPRGTVGWRRCTA